MPTCPGRPGRSTRSTGTGALQTQERTLRRAFPRVTLVPLVADFTMPLELPTLDGIVWLPVIHV